MEIHDLFSPPNTIQAIKSEDEVDSACSRYGVKQAYTLLVGTFEEWRPLRSTRMDERVKLK